MTLWTLPCFWLNEKAFHMVWQYLGLSGKGLKQEYLDSGHKSKWGLLTKLNANSETASLPLGCNCTLQNDAMCKQIIFATLTNTYICQFRQINFNQIEC